MTPGVQLLPPGSAAAIDKGLRAIADYREVAAVICAAGGDCSQMNADADRMEHALTVYKAKLIASGGYDQ